MGDKDIISKTILKKLVRDFATYLFHLPVNEVELLETSHQRIEDRHADLVGKVSMPGEPPFLLHIEIQNYNEAHMPVRMLRYLSDLLLAYPDFPVRQYLVYIGKEPLRMADGLRLPQFSYRYEVLDMRQVDCQLLLQQDSPDAWVLAVLCDFQNLKPREIIHTILSRLVGRLHDQPPRLREYIEMLDILAGNRDLNLNIREELTMLNLDIEKLATYQIGMEKGVAKGIHDHAVMTAKKLLAMHMEPARVALITDLPLSEIEALHTDQSN
jgi:predicted transposase YdaD